MNWIAIFNRLFEIINTPGDSYFSGTRFLNVVREANPGIPNYATFIEQRRETDKSTTRRDYYYDLFMELTNAGRRQVVNSILDSIEANEGERATALRVQLGAGQVAGPEPVVPQDLWNAERLIEYLERMDASIVTEDYGHTLTLAYTCLEGFYKSFIRTRIPAQVALNELNPMSVQIRNYIRGQLNANGIAYPDQVLTLISTVTNALCNARNDFSDSHSGNRAEKWLAVYLRDNVNSVVKLILNFV